ncbi:hypothetical protein DQ04_04061100 [Trypanosoma grayi]|uniref:hypothetical protein n=1 Tax=Trypanosoma grayi TaxID=71804 RepID=UPI0004F4AD4A|nr:hypothetical protein DQ04_04061100 [Trypanosoma grayi]KEG10200.1 hypothetical protein DQ04_04061100 [Trypanosoma grayi]
MQSQASPTAGVDKAQRSGDPGLPPVVMEKQIKVSNYSRSTAAALAGQLDNCVRLLQGHCATLLYCNEEIEGALLTLGVQTTHKLMSSITGVIEGLELVAGTCKSMCESHYEEIRQREDLFTSLSNMFVALKERQEATERELRTVVAERDRQNATFDKAVAYVEAVVAERAVWQEQNGYNCAGLPLVERSFTEHCHEALEVFDAIQQETQSRGLGSGERLLSRTDTPGTLVGRWETIENMRHTLIAPSARLQYVPPKDDVALLREVLEIGTASRALLRDVREERRGLEEAKKKVREIGVTSLAALQTARAELGSFKDWLLDLERRGYPFNTSIESFRGIVAEIEKRMVKHDSMDEGVQVDSD